MMDNVPALIVATAVLVAVPGPNVALIVAECLKQGLRYGLVTVLATTLGVGLQLVLVVGGLSALLEVAGSALAWIKWLGAAYLVWLGVRTWRRAADPDESVPRPTVDRAVSRAVFQGLLLAVLNPKTMLFNAAFLPQFVDSASQPAGELIMLAGVYLGVILTGDILWAVGANGARRWFVRVGKWRNRLSGGCLAAAGTGLGLAQYDG